MSDFDEHQHARDAHGKFAPRAGSEPTVSLNADCRDPEWNYREYERQERLALEARKQGSAMQQQAVVHETRALAHRIRIEHPGAATLIAGHSIDDSGGPAFAEVRAYSRDGSRVDPDEDVSLPDAPWAYEVGHELGDAPGATVTEDGVTVDIDELLRGD